MKPFREIDADASESAHIRYELDTYGYVLIRELLPIQSIQHLLGEILAILSESGWLLRGYDTLERMADPDAACGDSEPSFKSVYERIFNLESFHALAHHSRLRKAMQKIVGPDLLVHPKPIGRLIFPHCDRFLVKAHQDHLAIGGDQACFTAWMPLHDCPLEAGPLRILEGSHRFGSQKVDPVTGIISDENLRGGEWCHGRINAGDVLIFHGLTVHSASPNSSSQLRISMDCRFQSATHAINPANLVFPGSDNKSWEAVYAKWQSEDLKYFWKRQPLKFSPSVLDLTDLARNDTSSRMRVRHERILRQLRLQYPEADATNQPNQTSSELPVSTIRSA